MIPLHYQRIRDAYQNFSLLSDTDATFRPAQKTLFSSIAASFPPLGLTPVSALDRDVYYYQAQRVCRENILSLKPYAAKYCKTFKEVISLVEKSATPPADLKEKLDQLGKVHLEFANRFIPELMKSAHDQPPIVSLNYPQTLTLFLEAIFPDIQKYKQRIREQDPELVLMIPNLAIEKLLTSRSPMPELFQPYATELNKKRFVYNNLSKNEKVNLHLRLIGEKVELQPVTQELFKSIHTISSDLKRGEASPIFRVIFRELEKAIALLDVASRQNNSAKTLVYASLKLSEKDLPDALFDEKYRLKIRALRTHSTESEIESLADLIRQEPKAQPWLQLISS